eukprot:scaffold503219_cov13-Prasinocladus_malaysianus.AAC.1
MRVCCPNREVNLGKRCYKTVSKLVAYKPQKTTLGPLKRQGEKESQRKRKGKTTHKKEFKDKSEKKRRKEIKEGKKTTGGG